MVTNIQQESRRIVTMELDYDYDDGDEEEGSLNMTSSFRRNQQHSERSRRPFYKGFSTSICSFFHHPQDCCAFVCCGIFQWDFSYYLLHKKAPPSPFRTICRHVVMPSLIFLSAVLCFLFINDVGTAYTATSALLITCVLYIVVDCGLGMMARIQLRREIVEEAAKRFPSSPYDYKKPTYVDALCAHSLFYPRDDVDSDGHVVVNEQEQREGGDDVCTVMWDCLAKLFCGFICRCWFQACGVCAIAQEAREMRLIVQEKDTHMDHITYEPYSSYYPRLLHLRSVQNKNLFWHLGAISRLSKLLIKLLILSFIFCLGLAILDYFDVETTFELLDLAVFSATFLQAFLVMYVVHWRWNRFDLSLDAVIKYFASGFLFVVFLAIIFEMVVEQVVQALFLAVIALIVAVNPEYADQGESLYPSSTVGDDFVGRRQLATMEELQQEHPALALAYYFFTSFFVAALVEETCKYFGYMMVQHPDLMLNYNVEDETNTSSPTIVEELNNNSDNRNESSQRSPSTSVNAYRPLNSIDAGITVAMVSVAMGFACCENLVYIFIYTHGTPTMELNVLLARSIFPVHALCAAIQSIGVCRHVLEQDPNCKIGRIMLPAVIMHGGFDFSLMAISILTPSTATGNDWTMMAPFVIVGFGFLYYFILSDFQVKRLQSRDGARFAGERSNVVS